jgi:hypothetical protein
MLGGILRQSTFLNDDVCDRLNLVTAFQIKKRNGRFARILSVSASITPRRLKVRRLSPWSVA